MIIVFCRDCGKEFRLKVQASDVEKWRNGAYVQVAFPYLDASERELLISKTCGICWDVMFGFDDWEDDFASSQGL